MFHIALYEPEIPPNTGNIIRLCANTGSILHLVHPLGFRLDDRQLRRAGLDYAELANVIEHDSYRDFIRKVRPANIHAFSTRGKTLYTRATFRDGDTLLFGPETRGLPADILTEVGEKSILRIPMREGSRSLNLSNAVAVSLYEALRQTEFNLQV